MPSFCAESGWIVSIFVRSQYLQHAFERIDHHVILITSGSYFELPAMVHVLFEARLVPAKSYSTCVYMHIYIYTCVYIYIYIYIYECTCMYVYIYIYMILIMICIYIYIITCIYIYIHLSLSLYIYIYSDIGSPNRTITSVRRLSGVASSLPIGWRNTVEMFEISKSMKPYPPVVRCIYRYIEACNSRFWGTTNRWGFHPYSANFSIMARA